MDIVLTVNSQNYVIAFLAVLRWFLDGVIIECMFLYRGTLSRCEWALMSLFRYIESQRWGCSGRHLNSVVGLFFLVGSKLYFQIPLLVFRCKLNNFRSLKQDFGKILSF